VTNSNITTNVFASDSPYEKEKSNIGVVHTPMFEPNADMNHLEKLKRLLHSWVKFTREDGDSEDGFTSFELTRDP
jgi:hypothetical protein